MVTILLAVAAGGGSFYLAYGLGDWGLGWSIFMGVLGFGVFQGVAGFLIQKKVKAEMEKVQAILMNGQKQLEVKTHRWKFRPPSSLPAAQKEIFDDTKAFVKEALKQTESLRKYKPWVPMIERQIATAKLQLSWMIKDFKTVDALMPKAICLDPTMSWIQVKRGDVDGAFKTLTEALKKSDNDVLKLNHTALGNNRVAHFTNSGLGDQWYSLLLEEPRIHTQRMRSVYR